VSFRFFLVVGEPCESIVYLMCIKVLDFERVEINNLLVPSCVIALNLSPFIIYAQPAGAGELLHFLNFYHLF
jgi:hypothetical protein